VSTKPPLKLSSPGIPSFVATLFITPSLDRLRP
jgi:hypothetical protein